MKIISETALHSFKAWSGARDTQARIIEDGKADEFDSIIEDMYPDGLTDTELNDLLWFEEESIYEWLGMTNEDDSE